METNDTGGASPSSAGFERTKDVPLDSMGDNQDIEVNSRESGAETNLNEAQAGVQGIEAVSMTWRKWGLIAAYASIFLMAFTTSLEGQVVQSLSVFATSSFNNHSLISTVYVIQGVVNAVIKPPMAKIADVFGRLEAFSFSILLYVIGYIQMATSSNVQTYAAAQIFYSAGNTGLQILQQIFIADTSNLVNRALWSSMPDTPFLITVWIGSIIGSAIYKNTTWRWGYGIWCIILPAAVLPLAFTLFSNNRKAKKLGFTAPSQWKGIGIAQLLKKLLSEIDIGGIVLLSAGFALILIPLTIAGKASDGWKSGSIIAMLVIGFLCLVIFPLWESNTKLAPRPLIPLYLLKSRTFCAGCGVGFFYFMVFYLSVQPYFYSYLLVVQNQSITSAGHITQTFSFTSTITSIIISLIIKFTKVYKPYIVVGTLIYILGIGLMIKFRAQGVSVGQIVGTQICLGIGGGMLNVPAQLGVQASTDHQHVAVATAVYLTSVEIGGAVGSAISGAIWGKNIPAKLREYLPAAAKGDAMAIYNSIDVATGYRMGSAERIAIDRAYQETMRILLIVAICVAVPLVPLSLLMRDYGLEGREQGVKGRVIGGRVERGDVVAGNYERRKAWLWLPKMKSGPFRKTLDVQRDAHQSF